MKSIESVVGGLIVATAVIVGVLCLMQVEIRDMDALIKDHLPRAQHGTVGQFTLQMRCADSDVRFVEFRHRDDGGWITTKLPCIASGWQDIILVYPIERP